MMRYLAFMVVFSTFNSRFCSDVNDVNVILSNSYLIEPYHEDNMSTTCCRRLCCCNKVIIDILQV